MGVHPVHEALSTNYIKQLLRIKAHQLTRYKEFSFSEHSDLVQELTLCVLRQAHHFDPARASVNTFISRVVDSAVAMELRARRRLKRAGAISSRSLKEQGSTLHRERGRGSLSDILDDRDRRRHVGVEVVPDQQRAELESDMGYALSALSSHLQEVARRLIFATESAVARDLGISRRQVRNAVAAIRLHLQKSGLTKI